MPMLTPLTMPPRAEGRVTPTTERQRLTAQLELVAAEAAARGL